MDEIYTLKEWEQDGIAYRLDVLCEDTQVRGNALDSGDDAVDRECEDAIIAEYERGNALAWCCIRCTATFSGHSGTDYLGAVSCLGASAEADCIELVTSHHDMPAEAYADLERELENASTAYRAFLKRTQG